VTHPTPTDGELTSLAELTPTAIATLVDGPLSGFSPRPWHQRFTSLLVTGFGRRPAH